MKTIILTILALVILSSCRYKDNDRLNLLPVKNRLEKTWYMKECDLNGVDLKNYFPDLTYNTLTFFDMKNNKVFLYTNYDGGLGKAYQLKNNKTILTRSDLSSEYTMIITKLTKDELWMEGSRIFNTVGGLLSDKIKAKYSSKK